MESGISVLNLGTGFEDPVRAEGRRKKKVRLG
jgi:hypothetical protein